MLQNPTQGGADFGQFHTFSFCSILWINVSLVNTACLQTLYFPVVATLLFLAQRTSRKNVRIAKHRTIGRKRRNQKSILGPFRLAVSPSLKPAYFLLSGTPHASLGNSLLLPFPHQSLVRCHVYWARCLTQLGENQLNLKFLTHRFRLMYY